MDNQYQREVLAFGNEAINILHSSHVCVFGIGGVGSFCVEALARAGVGEISLVDDDVFSLTNLNRQLYATHSSIGKYKCDVAKERILDINPECKVHIYILRYLSDTKGQIDLSSFDYVVDAIDTIQGKISLVEEANKVNTPIIASMGAGNKIDVTKIEVGDIYSTSVDPLAKVLRKELKQRNIEKLKVVFSKEAPIEIKKEFLDDNKIVPSSNSFVPPAFGLTLAGEVILDLIKYRK